ncbi:hypothetical protein [Lacinutrix undariae]
MIKKIKTFLLILIPFTLVLFAAEYAVIDNLTTSEPMFYSLWAIFTFHFVATLLMYLLLVFIHNTFADNTGLAFMACTFLKMMAALVFLLPLILRKDLGYITDVLAFFVPYFLFLVLETIFTVKLLNSKAV